MNRFCTKEYPIPNLGLTIPEGTPIVISLLGVMRDPDNFPDPDNYLPDRFSEDKPMYNPDAFIPFGDGPRACIGNATLRVKNIFYQINQIVCFLQQVCAWAKWSLRLH